MLFRVYMYVSCLWEQRQRGFCFLTCTLRRPPATSTVSMQPPCSGLYILSYGLITAAVQRGGREPAEIRRADSRYCTSPRRKPLLCRTNSLRCRTPPSSRSLPSTHTHTLIQAQICRSGYAICVHAFSTHIYTHPYITNSGPSVCTDQVRTSFLWKYNWNLFFNVISN